MEPTERGDSAQDSRETLDLPILAEDVETGSTWVPDEFCEGKMLNLALTFLDD